MAEFRYRTALQPIYKNGASSIADDKFYIMVLKR